VVKAAGLYNQDDRHRDIILGKLAAMELRHNVEILFAVESGSRAWGYPSTDSDWDVRFVYRQRTEQYVRLLKQGDTLGKSEQGSLYDVTGWDVGKALKLSLSSNATLLEWMRSPMRYRWSPEAERISSMATRVANPRNLTWNYFNLARSFWEKHGKNEEQVDLKKYFYGLRPALALRHLRMYPGPPPMNLQELVETTDLSPNIARQIQEMVEEKASGRELGVGKRRDALDSVVTLELDKANETKPEKVQMVSDAKLLALTERLFMSIIGLDPDLLMAESGVVE
jgi:predicted nucleotidyltransferase